MANRFDPDGRLVFRESDHSYWLDGSKQLISVTAAIGEAYSGMLGEQFYTDIARQRGSAVHMAIMLAAEGTLDESSVHPIVRPYFEAYRAWASIEQPEWLHNEVPVFDEHVRAAGTLDGLGILRGPSRIRVPSPLFTVIDLVDWKSGHVPWSVGLQTAGYARMVRPYLPRNVVIRRWVLNLKSDGTFSFECCSEWPDAREHEADFLAAVRVAQLRVSRRRVLAADENNG